jgi:DnaJ-class molecular chaperone
MSVTCSHCAGTGKVPCTNCTGGWVQTVTGIPPYTQISTTVCTLCLGTGRKSCIVCYGKGKIDSDTSSIDWLKKETCTKCEGVGMLTGHDGDRTFCDVCGGKGYRYVAK